MIKFITAAMFMIACYFLGYFCGSTFNDKGDFR